MEIITGHTCLPQAGISQEAQIGATSIISSLPAGGQQDK